MNSEELQQSEDTHKWFLKHLLGFGSTDCAYKFFKYSEDYCDYVRRSMQAFGFPSEEVSKFAEECEYVTVYKKLLYELSHQHELLKFSGKIQEFIRSMDYYDREVHRRFVADWENHLTKEGPERGEDYAFLVHAMSAEDLMNFGGAQEVVCSIYTRTIHDLQNDYRMGYVYSLPKDGTIIVTSADCKNHEGSEASGPGTPKQEVPENECRHGDACLIPFNRFMGNCSPNRSGRIIFSPENRFVNKPIGIYINAHAVPILGTTPEEKGLVRQASGFLGIPIYEDYYGNLHIRYDYCGGRH